jgi:regulator of protease activity HflC (stomatin/prohibitin superfamily)
MVWFIIGILALIVGVIVAIYQGVENGSGAATVAGVATAIVVAVLIGLSCMASVPTGHTGVLTTFGKVEDRTLEAGMNFKAPWQNVIKMDNRVQKQTTDLICFSSDIQEVSMKYTVNYQISSKDAMTIYRTIGVDYYANIIVPNITESVKTSVAHYNAEALVSDRSALSQKIQEDLTTRLANYNIIVVSASIEDMDFTDAFTNAVEAKQVAEQNKLKAQTEAEQKVIEAEAAAKIKQVDAEAAATAKKTAADAEAYEIGVKATAEAEANKQLASSITQQLIDYKYYETWDGKLPGVVGADTIIKMPDQG